MKKLSLLSDLRNLIEIVYSIKFPKHEIYGIQTQIRRAVISVSLNIREGNVFNGAERLRFFRIALASLNEVDECIEICEKLGYIDDLISLDFKDSYWLCLNKLNKLISFNKQNIQTK